MSRPPSPTPPVPNLAKIAWAEIERQREKVGIPKLVLDAALSLQSRNAKTYRARIGAAKTERELSDVFEDMIDRVPLGRTFFADRNPVRTGGPMQVAIAHLLDYPASYDRYLYRYADFNAGHYASRNAAFQSALAAPFPARSCLTRGAKETR